jgi:hypothetical protein
VRSVPHEPQSECFEPHRLRVALALARLLGPDYDVWIAGEGFNTQWHFHVQFRKQRSVAWAYVLSRQPASGDPIGSFPSRPWYFEDSSESEMVDGLAAVARADGGARGLLVTHDSGVWRALFVRSYPAGRLFNKLLGLHEHLGEVILESEAEFARIERDVPTAAAQLEDTLRRWSR